MFGVAEIILKKIHRRK